MKSIAEDNSKIGKVKKTGQIKTALSELSKLDFKLVLLFVSVTFSLVFIKYLGNFHDAADLLKSIGIDSLDNYRNFAVKNLDIKFIEKIYWVSVNIFFYLFLPIVLIIFVYKKPITDFGFKNFFALNRNSIKWFFIFLAIMVPLVFLVSHQESFQKKYPFYTPPGNELLWPKFYIWQLFYFVQFVALEFFFRGFIIQGLKKNFGYYSIFIMLIPYVMIHFQKPLPETIGAVFAGIILGYLSMRKGSISLGIALHYSVALCMDLFSLYHR